MDTITYCDIGAGLKIPDDIFNYKNIDFIAFEPLDPKTRVPKLDKINNYVVNDCAVYNENKNNAKLYVYNKSAVSSLLQLNENIFKNSSDKFKLKKTISVKTRTLDSFNYKNIDILKIDAQGAGYEIIEGAKKTLKNTTVVVIELEFFQLYKNQKLAWDCINLMEELNFTLKKVHSVHKIENLGWVYGDFIFTNNDRSIFKNKIDLTKFGLPDENTKSILWRIFSKIF